MLLRPACRRLPRTLPPLGAFISLDEFKALYGPAFSDRRKIPKMIDLLFADPQTEGERAIKALIDKRKLDDLRRTEPKDRDARIFPGVYAPVTVSEGGKLVVKPMRYQCRLAGKPAFYDVKYPGTYNARSDNLEGFWKGQFGHTHGLMIVKTFFENVDRDGKNVVLQFTPDDREPMLVACLWSRWTG